MNIKKTTDLVYFETVIEDNSHNIITLASTTKSKTGSKTIYCKDADGKVLWYVKVTGTFLMMEAHQHVPLFL